MPRASSVRRDVAARADVAESEQTAAGHPDEPPLRRVGVGELAPLLADWRDPRAGRAAYRALAERLQLLVLDGRLPVHAMLPSERRLAQAASISRTTTTAAYQLLRERGFARAGHGAGTWTALPHPPGQQDGPDPWPVTTSTDRGSPDGRGDLASAAPEAPAQVHGAYAAALADLPRYLPGHGYVTAGLPALRDAIARRYTDRGLPTAPEEVLVTAGAMHGLRLVAAALLGRGDRVLVENPSYPLSLDLIRRAGGRPVGIDVEDGWNGPGTASALRSARPRLAYLMPDFQNPTGQLLDADGRDELAATLTAAGCTAVVDETTADLDLRGALAGSEPVPLPAPFPVFSPAAVCLGSASKTFWGGLRVGWVRADRALVRRMTVLRAADDLGSPVVEQLAVVHLLDDVQTVLADRRRTLAARFGALRGALGSELPSWSVPVPQGGMVAWCRLPAPRSSELAAAARTLGVTLTPGPRFCTGGGGEHRVRLPFARPAGELVAAVGLLAAAWSGRPPEAGPDDPDSPGPW